MEQNKTSPETLGENELTAVTGGATQNRYDPVECSKTGRTRYECVGALKLTYCDHYKPRNTGICLDGKIIFNHKCDMGCFDYNGDGNEV